MNRKLLFCSAALISVWLLPPVALAADDGAAASTTSATAATDASGSMQNDGKVVKHHRKHHIARKHRHKRHARRAGAHNRTAGDVRCQVFEHNRWHSMACADVAGNDTSGKAISSGMSQTGAMAAPMPAAPAPEPQVAAAPPPAPEPVAPPAAPEITSEITFGAQLVTGTNSGQAGRYDGFTNQGADLLFGFDFSRRPGWNSGDTSYYSFSGTNLNFQTGDKLAKNFSDNAYTSGTANKLGPTADLHLAFGNQGKWGVTADYSALSYTGNIISSLWTVDNGAGFLNNNRAPWGGASNSPLTKGTTTAFTSTTLAPNFDSLQTGTRRDRLQIGGKVELGDWTLKADVQHEHKQGTLEESVRQTYGGMAFTLPADYDTDRFDMSATYIDPDFQAVIQYTYSRFSDNNLGVTLPYVVSISSLTASSGPYAQTAFYSTPPGNSAHYVTVMLADKLAPHTRVVFNGHVGVEIQDSMFAPNSADPNLSPTLGNPTYTWFANLNSHNMGTTNTSLNAEAWVYQASLSVTTELATHLDGRASYSVDGRNVSFDEYKVWFGGSSLDATANSFAYAVPQNWTKQNASVELDYLVVPESNTKLTVNYTFNNTNRTNAQVEHSITNTASIQLSSMIGTAVLGRISYEHGDRSGTMHYGTAWGNLEAGAPEEDGTPSGAYYMAPMTSDTVVMRVDYAPAGDLSGGLFLKGVDNRYHYPAVESVATATNSGNWNLVGHGEGITRDYNFTVGPDVNYRPSNDLNLHVYYTYERIFFDNRGNGACSESNTGTCLGTAGYFQNKYTSSMNTAGISGEWQANERLKLGAEYNISTGSVIFGQYNGVMVTTVTQSYQNVVSYPDINSTMHDLKLTAVYQFSDSFEGSLMYRYSMFSNDDWQFVPSPVITSTDTGTAISIVNAGYGPPKYNVSTVGMFFRVKL